MITLRQSILIYRPVDEVFAFAGDPANDPHWIASLWESARTAPGPLGIGAEFRRHSKFLARRVELSVRIAAYEPGRLVALERAEQPITFRESRRFAAMGHDTRLERSVEAEVGGLFRMSEALVADAGRRQFETDLYLLKVLLDARAEIDLPR